MSISDLFDLGHYATLAEVGQSLAPENPDDRRLVALAVNFAVGRDAAIGFIDNHQSRALDREELQWAELEIKLLEDPDFSLSEGLLEKLSNHQVRNYLRAVALEKEGRLDDAIEVLRDAWLYETGEYKRSCIERLVAIYIRASKLELASQVAQDELARERTWYALRQVAVTELVMDNLEQTRLLLDQAIELTSPNNVYLASTEASLSFMKGDFQACIEKISFVLTEWPRDAHEWYFLGKSYAAMGDRAKAEAAVQRSVDIEPELRNLKLLTTIQFHRLKVGHAARSLWQYLTVKQD